MKTLLKQLKRVFSISLIALLIIISSVLTSPKPAFAFSSTQIEQILSNKQLTSDVNKYLKETPETFCQAYVDMLNGTDSSAWDAIKAAISSSLTIAGAATSASAAGAGALTGYAGIASAVSQLGLGGLMTTVAGMMGSSAAGAAATAVVTAAVGGPLVMAGLMTVGLGAAAFGTSKLATSSVEKLEDVAKNYCLHR